MTRCVFVVNCGSSSLKYRLVDLDSHRSPAWGIVERIGGPDPRIIHEGSGRREARPVAAADHEAALRAVLDALDRTGPGLAGAALVAVAHRVVHGGDRFSAPVVVDDEVLAAIRALSALAPLHNPVNARGLEVARRVLVDVPHVAVFDTAFHHTLPPHAYTYAVPVEWAREHGVRRYGFHGTSHAYVARTAARLLDRDPARTNLIVLHLGNGASAAAVAGGESVDTSMGLTPLEGLVMGTRSGDLDPAVVLHLLRSGLGRDEIDDGLNRESGLRALAGASDMREIHRRADGGDAAAALALDVYCYRIRKYVGAYFAVLGHVDAIVFTAGVGENDPEVRSRSLSGLEALGIVVDAARNTAPAHGPRVVSSEDAAVAVLVVPTDEELEMATQAADLVAARALTDPAPGTVEPAPGEPPARARR